MKRGLLAIVGAALIASGSIATFPGSTPASAQEAPKVKAKKGLKGTIGYRRAYSYSKSQVVGTETRRFYDPSYTRQGGPFDNGFFFDSAIGRNGGEAPYMH